MNLLFLPVAGTFHTYPDIQLCVCVRNVFLDIGGNIVHQSALAIERAHDVAWPR